MEKAPLRAGLCVALLTLLISASETRLKHHPENRHSGHENNKHGGVKEEQVHRYSSFGWPLMRETMLAMA